MRVCSLWLLVDKGLMEKNGLCQEIAPNVDRGTGTGIKVRNGMTEHSSRMWIPPKKYVTVNGEDTPEYFGQSLLLLLTITGLSAQY